MSIRYFSFFADDVRGSDQRRLRRPPPVNPGAPRLTKDDYFTVPDMKRLRRMRDEELKARHQNTHNKCVREYCTIICDLEGQGLNSD